MHEQLGRVGAVLVTVALTLSAGTAAQAGKGGEPGENGKPDDKRSDHCISPSGRDVNELWGIDDTIVASFCPEAHAGEKLTTTNVWLMAQTFEAAPEGFVPAGDTPLEDFRAKFGGVRYVIDPGTTQERTYLFDDVTKLGVQETDGFDVVNIVTMGTVHPLSVGSHVMETYWIFNAEHCDGLDDDRFANCFPAGVTPYDRFSFEVNAKSSHD